jgi:hypothetical protein
MKYLIVGLMLVGCASQETLDVCENGVDKQMPAGKARDAVLDQSAQMGTCNQGKVTLKQGSKKTRSGSLYITGDFNQSGAIDLGDVVASYNAVMNFEDLECPRQADITLSGSVQIFDHYVLVSDWLGYAFLNEETPDFLGNEISPGECDI